MKIGILTYHRAHNYGAILQCYALSSILKERGHEVEVIDYYPSYFKAEYMLIPACKNGVVNWVKECIKLIPILTVKKQRIRLFNSFIENHLPLSKTKYNEVNKSIEGYDVILFGSDQIWNPLLSNGEDPIYSGFFDKNGAKFVSYAASTNPKLCTEEYVPYFRNIIDAFDRISVREKSLADYLNIIKPEVAVNVLDPVLLPQVSTWDTIAKKPSEENYLLIYTVPQTQKVWQHARFIAEKLGLSIVEITSKARNKKGSEMNQLVGPMEFLGYFKYAKYVVTTSFHGTAFSIKYGKQFSTISVNSAVDDRAFSLLENVGLEERLITDDSLYTIPHIIDYDRVFPRLNTIIEKSLSFIDSNTINSNE